MHPTYKQWKSEYRKIKIHKNCWRSKSNLTICIGWLVDQIHRFAQIRFPAFGFVDFGLNGIQISCQRCRHVTHRERRWRCPQAFVLQRTGIRRKNIFFAWRNAERLLCGVCGRATERHRTCHICQIWFIVVRIRLNIFFVKIIREFLICLIFLFIYFFFLFSHYFFFIFFFWCFLLIFFI